jgi:hypothetical protein
MARPAAARLIWRWPSDTAIQNGFETLFTTAAELIEDLSNTSKKRHLPARVVGNLYPSSRSGDR